MSRFSANYLNSFGFPVVGCDSWANVRIGTSNAGQPTSIVNASGITGAARRNTGIHGISFSNPNRYGNGGHVVITTHEADDFSTYMIPQVGKPVVDASTWGATTDVGRTAGFSLYTWAFASPAGASGHTLERADLSYASGHHVNFVAFSFSRHGLISNYSPTISGACSAARAYSPYVRNLLKHSENPNDAVWSSASTGGLTRTLDESISAPDGISTAWRFTPQANTNQTAANVYVQQTATTALCTGRRYTFSAYVKSGSMPSPFFYLRMYSVSGTDYAQSSFDLTSSATNTSGSWSDTRRGQLDVGNGWYRIFVSARWTGASDATLIARFYAGCSPVVYSSPPTPHDGINWLYGTGFQVEESHEPTPYIYTESSAPVLGDQDYKRVFVPGSAGFGVTGSTHNSASVAMNSERTPTAYGTIVIPAYVGGESNPAAYIEGGYNVLGGVSTGSNSEFDITFKTPLNTQNYCVILSNEIEPVPQASPDYGDVNEPVITMIERANKTTAGFRVVALRQVKNSQAGGGVLANSFSRQSNWYQRGLSHRIHFMVFGGGTYGQQ